MEPQAERKGYSKNSTTSGRTESQGATQGIQINDKVAFCNGRTIHGSFLTQVYRHHHLDIEEDQVS